MSSADRFQVEDIAEQLVDNLLDSLSCCSSQVSLGLLLAPVACCSCLSVALPVQRRNTNLACSAVETLAAEPKHSQTSNQMIGSHREGEGVGGLIHGGKGTRRGKEKQLID